jgi:hypothetical protein
MTNPCYEEVESLAEMPDRSPLSNGLSGAFAIFSHIAEQELFGDYGGYPSRHEGPYFMREGRRTTTELHGDVLPEQLYQLDGCFALEYEEI